MSTALASLILTQFHLSAKRLRREMSFLKCCVGADPRPPPESIRPVGASSNPNRRAGRAGAVSGGGMRQDPLGGNKKLKMPNEVFFDPSKPDGQLSSVTDPPTSAREYTDGKKRKDHKDRSGHASRGTGKAGGKTGGDEKGKGDLDAPDNNGLTRGQNFMKVEKWLRSAVMFQQVDITPGVITNLEDLPTELPENAVDPPSEKDRLPPSVIAQRASSKSR